MNKDLSQGKRVKCTLYLKDKMRERAHDMREMGVRWEIDSGIKERGRLVGSEGSNPIAYPWQVRIDRTSRWRSLCFYWFRPQFL